MKALDLFAGTGWGVACKRLGIDEVGVEIMPEAIETRAANGMETIYNDVWDGLLHKYDVGEYDILIASPPCQTFSMAGRGAGRQALDQVLDAISAGAYKNASELHDLGERTDMRTALVLTPLAHVYRDRPTYVVFEQVPPVLPVWEACAEEMRKIGYSVWTGNVQAEQYGVPQTRKRAILIARNDGVEATIPTPTHSKYYSANPAKIDDGVERWVSMHEALDIHPDSYLRHGKQKNAAVRGANEPSATMAFGHDSASFGWGFVDRPAITVSNAVGRGLQGGSGGRKAIKDAVESGTFVPSVHAKDASHAEVTRITVAEAGVLQSYPADFDWRGSKTKQFLQIGNAVPPKLGEVILKSFL